MCKGGVRVPRFRAAARLCGLAAALLLAACGGQAAASGAAAAAPPTAAPTVPGTTGGGYTAPPLQLSPFDAAAAVGENGVLIDASSVAQGYVAASAVNDNRLKFQVVYGESKYNYDLPGDGTPQSFPLQSGDGSYTFRVMQNTTADKYIEICSFTADVQLESEFAPFLRPSQFVDYTQDSACVALAAGLAAEASGEAGAVANIYAYIRDHIAYDRDKAATVQSGYLPDPDATLAAGKGICFDYAALAAAMLRSQGIPTKLITGYVSQGELYHAWNMIWLEETGWITVQIEAPAHAWERIDLTFAAGAPGEYTGDGTDYTDRLTY